MKVTSVSKGTTYFLFIAGVMAMAQTQAADTSNWICEFCPFEKGLQASIVIGATSVSDDSAYFGDASGYGDDGVYANVNGDGTYTSDDHRLQWQVEDLGLDSRVAALRGGRQGSYDYNVSYRQLPRTQFFTSDTVFLSSSTGTLSLPANWVSAPLTSGFSELNSSLTSRNIESERKMLEIGARYLPSSRFTFAANFRRQERDGIDVRAGSFFTQSSLLPAPLDHVTNTVDLGIRYAGDKGFMLLAYYMSDFNNGNKELRWENPFTSAAGAETVALAESPDNTYQQLSLSGSYGFSQNKTMVRFSASAGRLEQDESFLGYTTNTNLPDLILPATSLDAAIDTTNLAFTVTSRVFRNAHVKFAYRYDKRDNKTAQHVWTRVIADSFLSGESELNIPYSFERSTLTLGADYDLIDTVRISGGYDHKTIDRDFQEVAEQTEDSGWGQLRWRPNGLLEIRIKGGVSERDIDRYNETVAATFGENPLMRKFNLAYRYRRFGELTVSAALPETPLGLTITGMMADDDYSESRLGMTASDDLRIAADVSWTLTEKASLYLTGGYESIESKQFGSEFFAAPDWQAVSTDDFYTAGGGIRIRQIGDKLDLQLDYTRSDGTSEINVTSASDGMRRFPDLKSTLDYLRLRLSYHRSDRLDLTMNLRYQSFSAEDWALEGVGPSTIPVVLTLGANPYDDDQFIFGIGFRYLIGESAESLSE